MLNFNPIRLTELGEMLIDDPKLKFTEKLKLDGCLGIHAFCGGLIFIRRVSIAHKAIFCLDCCLRIIVPAEVVTYDDLRKYLKGNN